MRHDTYGNRLQFLMTSRIVVVVAAVLFLLGGVFTSNNLAFVLSLLFFELTIITSIELQYMMQPIHIKKLEVVDDINKQSGVATAVKVQAGLVPQLTEKELWLP